MFSHTVHIYQHYVGENQDRSGIKADFKFKILNGHKDFPDLSRHRSPTFVYLSSAVDKIFTLDGAPVSLHRHHLTLLDQDLLHRGSIQDLNP